MVRKTAGAQDRFSVYNPRGIILLLLSVVALTSPSWGQVGSIFKSRYFPITLGRSVLTQVKLSAPLVYSIADSTVAKFEGRFITALKAGKTFLRARTADNALKDTAEIVITFWLSGISSLNVTDSFKNFAVIGVKNDSIIGYSEVSSTRAKTLMSLRTNFSGWDSLAQFNAVPGYFFSSPAGSFILEKKVSDALPKKLYKSNDLKSWHPVMNAFPNGSYARAPDSYFTFQGACADDEGNLYIAEYLSEDSLYPDYRIKIFKSSNGGESWDSIYAFPPRSTWYLAGGVRHIHTIAFDPYQKYLWFSTGDNAEQSRIYYHTNKLLPDSTGQVNLQLLGGYYHEDFKTLGFIFTKDYIYWGMDSPTDSQKVFRIARRDIYPNITVGPHPKITSKNDYRELVGVFRDKAFWHNIKVVNAGDSMYLLQASYEQDFAPMIDRRARTYILREGTYPQVQEVYGMDATSNYDYFYPRGQLSDGAIIFHRNRIIAARNSAYKARLNWVDTDRGIWQSTVPDKLAFHGGELELSGTFSKKGNVYSIKHSLTDLPAPLPDSLIALGDSCYELFSPDCALANGYFQIAASGDNNAVRNWLAFDRRTNAWKNLHARYTNGKLVSAVPVSEFSWVVPASFTMASKYAGGAFDGGSDLELPLRLMNGEVTALQKYYGGSYDGHFSVPDRRGFLNGMEPDWNKYFGGSFDGQSLASINLMTPGGNTPLSSKYSGGSFSGASTVQLGPALPGGEEPLIAKFHGNGHDGAALAIRPTGFFKGGAPDWAKYSGGSYDGFFLETLPLLPPGGTMPDIAKYEGGSYDGNAVQSIAVQTPGAVFSEIAKYYGGAYDGGSTRELPAAIPDGTQPLLVKYRGAGYDGSASSTHSTGTLSGIFPLTAKYAGGNYDGSVQSIVDYGNLSGVAVVAARYVGGAYDGASATAINNGTPGSVFPLLSKFAGGYYDGSVHSVVEYGNLNGIAAAAARYVGGAYDGASVTAINNGTPGSVFPLLSKFAGGNYDGAALSIVGYGNLSGVAVSAARYSGGAYDGHSALLVNTGALNGVYPSLAKYGGGFYDGSTLNLFTAGSLSGFQLSANKYTGGGFDGASGITGIPSHPDGRLLTLAKYAGGNHDGYKHTLLPSVSLGGFFLLTQKYSGGGYDGAFTAGLIPAGLGGSQLAYTKFAGGSYDGYAKFTAGISAPGGNLLSDGKYRGGLRDGFASVTLSNANSSGQTALIAKYSGGQYDGYSVIAMQAQPVFVLTHKYNGGFYDGNHSVAGQKGNMNGELLAASKYSGGGFDGTDSRISLFSALNGGTLAFRKFYGGAYDGFSSGFFTRTPLPVIVNFTMYIEGFYDPILDEMNAADTVRGALMRSLPPYDEVDSAYTILTKNGTGTFTFENVTGGDYYLALRHRNSIETWSQSPQSLGAVPLAYNFASDSAQAFGDNMVKRGTRWCIYSGDVNQDGIVDFTDLVLVDNASLNFTGGYVSTDITGDDFVDFSDLSLCDNNSLNFVISVKPGLSKIPLRPRPALFHQRKSD